MKLSRTVCYGSSVNKFRFDSSVPVSSEEDITDKISTTLYSALIPRSVGNDVFGVLKVFTLIL